MSKYKAILFDMDGTLVPMDHKTFMRGYFKLILGVLSSFGDDANTLFAGFMKGIEAMNNTDGSKSNKQTFWDTFSRYIKGDVEEYIRAADEFYYGDFVKAKQFTEENPLAKRAVELARGNGRQVALATNPMFPLHAQLARLSWVGLGADDFDLITDYDSDNHTKPQKEYYLSVCERLGVKPEECLMVGNDERDDMMGASLAGIDCFLITDCLIPCDGYRWEGERGTFAQLVKKLEEID